MKNWIVIAATVFLAGCATANFRPYVGKQQAWPTAAGGSIVNTRYDLPVFMCPPSAPYEVLGELKVRGGLHDRSAEECLPLAAKRAKELGADALLLVNGPQFFSAAAAGHTSEITKEVSARSPRFSTVAGRAGAPVTTFTVMSFDPNVVILAIRWTSGPPAGLAKK